MQFYIKKWSDRTVALMTATGQVLAYFPSILEAITACKEWYMFNDIEPNEIILSDDRMAPDTETIDTLHGYGF
jgi:hypothetical protein